MSGAKKIDSRAAADEINMKPEKLRGEMTDKEMHDRLGVLRKKLDWNNKYVVPLTIGIGAVGVLLAAGTGLGLLAIPVAPTMIFALAGIVAPTFLGLASIKRDEHMREIKDLSDDNERRIYVAEKQQIRAEVNERLAKQKAAMESSLRLRKEFEAALADMAEGKGTRRDVTVGKPLSLKKNNKASTMFSCLNPLR